MREGVLTDVFLGTCAGVSFFVWCILAGGRESGGIGFWSLIFGWGAGRWPVQQHVSRVYYGGFQVSFYLWRIGLLRKH